MIAFDRTKHQAIWMFFEGQLGTFAKLQAISNWFGEDDTTGFVNSETDWPEQKPWARRR
jgi:hypothetical protein